MLRGYWGFVPRFVLQYTTILSIYPRRQWSIIFIDSLLPKTPINLMTLAPQMQYLSIGGLTDYLKTLIEGQKALQQVWIVGEVSDSPSEHKSGLFFSATDPESQAKIRCVIWRRDLPQLSTLPLRGQQYFFYGSVRVYVQGGQYNFAISQILPAGEGLQALRLEQLRQRLQAEGLFDPERKRPLPSHPQVIAVVTSPQAAAWGDIQRTLNQRYPGLEVLLSPAIVQGEQAPDSIVKAIQRVEKDGRAEVIILARGGGAVEDLACFNDERIVRAIVESPIPVITGIGHQRDESLADLAADLAAHTPTAAAQKVVPDFGALVREQEQHRRRLINAVEASLSAEKQRLSKIKHQLQQLPQTSRTIQKEESQCQLWRQKLIALDPKAVLSRGYGVVTAKNGQMIDQVSKLREEQELWIQLSQGRVKVKVMEIYE